MGGLAVPFTPRDTMSRITNMILLLESSTEYVQALPGFLSTTHEWFHNTVASVCDTPGPGTANGPSGDECYTWVFKLYGYGVRVLRPACLVCRPESISRRSSWSLLARSWRQADSRLLVVLSSRPPFAWLTAFSYRRRRAGCRYASRPGSWYPSETYPRSC